MDLTWLLFIGMAAVILITAAGVVLMRNAIYAALFLVANFSFVAVLYLIITFFAIAGHYILLNAQFLAIVHIIVYAGAIMVLFLFVIMLLGAEKLPTSTVLSQQRWLAVVLGVIALADIGLLVIARWGNNLPLPDHAADYASPNQIGMLLFTQYALPFEITSVILLVAVVGAVVLTRPDEMSIRTRLLGLKDKKKE